MSIRLATEADHDRLWELAQAAHLASRYAKYPIDRRYLEGLYALSVSDPDHYAVLVWQDGFGTIGGFLMAFARHSWFGPAVIAYDVTFYVAPGFRHTAAAPHLVAAYRKWATEKGADETWLGTTSGIRDFDVGRFYERQGFKRVGGLYVCYNTTDEQPERSPNSSPA